MPRGTRHPLGTRGDPNSGAQIDAASGSVREGGIKINPWAQGRRVRRSLSPGIEESSFSSRNRGSVELLTSILVEPVTMLCHIEDRRSSCWQGWELGVSNRVIAPKKRWPFHICKNAPHGTLAALFWVRKGGTGHSKAAARFMARGTGAQCDRQLWRRLAGRSAWLLTSSDSAAGGLLQLGMLPASRAASLQQNDAA